MRRSREQLQRILDLAASQSHTKEIVSAEDFLALVKNRNLAGSQKFSEDAEAVINVYVAVNLAGGEPLKNYVKQVFRFIPDSEFDKPINPKTDITLGDAILLAQYALMKWPAIDKDKNHIKDLPLAI